jgi:hypothetical protein
MRKRTAPPLLGTVTAVLSFGLLAVACSRSSGTSDSVRVDSAGGGTGTASSFPAPAAMRASSLPAAAPMMAQREEAVARRMRAASAPPIARDAGVASAVANDSRAVSLGTPVPQADPSGTMLIRSGQASIEVKRVDDAVAKLRQTAAQFGGFVANTSIVGGKEEHRSAQLEIRVPSPQFDAAVAALGALGKVESVSATVQDVGEEYVDLSARAANARRVEARLVEMLASRTGKLSEVMMVEQELRRVREEIERYDARLKWLERKTSLSSLDVALHEPMSLLDERGPNPIAEAFVEAWRRAVGVLAWCIASLGVIVPLGLLLAGTLLLARRLLRPGTPPGVSGA